MSGCWAVIVRLCLAVNLCLDLSSCDRTLMQTHGVSDGTVKRARDPQEPQSGTPPGHKHRAGTVG